MTCRRFLQAFAAAPLIAAAVSRSAAVLAAPAPVARPQVVPPDASFMATRPGLLEVSSVPGIRIGVVPRARMMFMATRPGLLEVSSVPGIRIGVVPHARMMWQPQAGATDLKLETPASAQAIWKAASLSKHANGPRAIERVFGAATGHGHPVFLWA